MTPRQMELLLFIERRIAADGYAPTYSEMAPFTGGGSGAHRMVDLLVEDGWLRRTPNRARGLEVIRPAGTTLAGFSSEALRAELARRGEAA